MLRGRRHTKPTAVGRWAGEGLVFLVGHPRSGTTFLGRLLGAHPSIGYWEEPAVLQFVNQVHHELRRLEQHLQLDAQIDTFTLREVGNTRKQNSLDAHQVQLADERAVTRTRELVQHLVEDFRTLSGRPIVVEKTPMGIGMLGALGSVLPEARAIHIVRDPRDIVASIHRMVPLKGRPGWLRDDGDVAHALATQWLALVGGAIEAEGTHSGAIHRLRHEDVVERPERELKALFEFLGIDWTHEIDEFLQSGHSGGLDPSRSGAWRDEVSVDEVHAVAAVAGGLMRELGYEAADGAEC